MTQPPGLQPSQAPRRPLARLRGHKRLAGGSAAFGLLLAIGAIAAVAGGGGGGGTAATVADPGGRSITAAAKASTRATVRAGAGGTARAGAATTPRAGGGDTAIGGAGPSAQASAKASAKAGTEPGPSSGRPAAPITAQDCSDQARAWLNGGSSHQIAALESAFGALYAAGNALVSAAGHGASRDLPAVEGAARALRSAAGAVEANPGPSCVSGLRANLMSGAADYSTVASDVDSAVGEYEAGQVRAAQADVEAARPLAAAATASITAAEAAENVSG